MNINIQACGIIIITVIIYFNCSQTRLKLKTNNAYIAILINTTVCLMLDILSIVCIKNSSLIDGFLVSIICKLYLISLMSEAYWGILYTYADITRKYNKIDTITNISIITLIISSIATMILPIDWVYINNGSVVYTEGLACNITYAYCLSTIILNIVTCIKNRKIMTNKRFYSIIMWMMLWIIAALIQLFNSSILIVSFASVVGVMIIYFQLENPEKYRESNFKCFNQQAFIAYINQMYKDNIKFSLLVAYDLNLYARADMGQEDIRNIRKKYLKFLSTFTRLTFLYEHDKVILVFDNDQSCEMALDAIILASKKEFKGDGEFLKPFLYTIYDSTLLKSSDTMLNTINYTSMNLVQYEDRHDYINITENTLKMIEDENKIIGMIHRAIKDDRVEVFYQPIYSTKHHKFISAEALVRIRETNGNLIYPNVFIPIAEKSNLIIKLGHLIFVKVCKFISENNIKNMGLQYIEINLSVAQCSYHSLSHDFIKVMNRYNIDSKCINLEITESASYSSKVTLLNNMNKLIQKGVTFSLDDFGTGNSNFNYVMDMPVKIVKFDKEMVEEYFSNDKSNFIMSNIIKMVKGLNLEIVAEGVETEQQLNSLIDIGIDFIQGYYFSRPVNRQKFIEFILLNNKR